MTAGTTAEGAGRGLPTDTNGHTVQALRAAHTSFTPLAQP